MKLVVLDGKPFIRVGGKTLAPVEALDHFRSRVDEARREIAIRDNEAQRVRADWCRAVETGAAFDRARLIEANNKADAARKLHETAEAQLDECHALVCATAATRAVAELNAEIERILSRFEPV